MTTGLAMPDRCPPADRMRWEWYDEPEETQGYFLEALQYHRAHCIACLKQAEWLDKMTETAIHPDLTAEEIANA